MPDFPEFADAAAVTPRLAANEAPPSAIRAYTVARVVAGTKPNGEIRPFAIGGVVRRWLPKLPRA
eukprot:9659624-Alexandrium_andersonii.AAC.1